MYSEFKLKLEKVQMRKKKGQRLIFLLVYRDFYAFRSVEEEI